MKNPDETCANCGHERQPWHENAPTKCVKPRCCNDTRATPRLVVVVLMVCALSVPTTLRADNGPIAAFNAMKPSLALVIAGAKPDVRAGTAFCVASNGVTSYFVTNKHVVGNDNAPRLILMATSQKVVTGHVIRRGNPLDVAIIAVPIGNVAPVAIGQLQPAIGQAIGISGFPSIQIELFEKGLGLAPSIHLGTISSIVASSALLEYDAATDHGNSGGPLFDAATGTVYGIVTWLNTGESGAVQNNFAIPMVAVVPFLRNAHLALTSTPDYSNSGEDQTPQSPSFATCNWSLAETTFKNAQAVSVRGDNAQQGARSREYYLEALQLFESASSIYSACAGEESGDDAATSMYNAVLALSDAASLYQEIGRIDRSTTMLGKARLEFLLALALDTELSDDSEISEDTRASARDNINLIKQTLKEIEEEQRALSPPTPRSTFEGPPTPPARPTARPSSTSQLQRPI